MAGLSVFENRILDRLDKIASSLKKLEPKRELPQTSEEWAGPVVPAILDWEIPGIKATGYYTKVGMNHLRLVVDIHGVDAERAFKLHEFMEDTILISAIDKENNG